ncbi:hypothetical protein SKAU_G00138190 [Synaphobranchus kaupii]|uniref:BESS domain-containing protein n=1 Tax=Synaphobranchus kaupii TaxID=118154 RepID=A0A9Q1FSS6_SYNKA|nr:hypothetical protein SKAU_G00138190 [Synaphobranchus kaupii]
MRDAFNNNRKNAEKRSGDVLKSIKPYKYAECMVFLLRHGKPRKTCREEEEGRGEQADHQSTKRPLQKPTQGNKKTSTSVRAELDVAMKEYLMQRASQRVEDDLDLFFCSMATTVRKMPEHVKIDLKFKINEIVHRAKMELMCAQAQAQASHSGWDHGMNAFNFLYVCKMK